MNISSKYMIFWMAVVTGAFIADYTGLLKMMELDGMSFMVGLIVGFLIMKLAPPVQEKKPEEKP